MMSKIETKSGYYIILFTNNILSRLKHKSYKTETKNYTTITWFRRRNGIKIYNFLIFLFILKTIVMIFIINEN